MSLFPKKVEYPFKHSQCPNLLTCFHSLLQEQIDVGNSKWGYRGWFCCSGWIRMVLSTHNQYIVIIKMDFIAVYTPFHVLKRW